MTGQPAHRLAIKRESLNRRVVLKASASFAAMATIGGLVGGHVRAQESASGTRAGKWIEEDQVGAFAAASSSQVFEADFPFYAIAPHWGGDGDPDCYVEMRFSGDGQSWTEPLIVGVANDDAGQPDREGRNFGRLVILESAASFVEYQSLDPNGNPAGLPTLAFTYIDATGGPTLDQVYAAALSPTIEPPPIISRAAWGADERYRHENQNLANPIIWPPETQTVEHVIIHHSATPNFQDPLPTVRSIYYYHAVERGWGDIGYNYLVDHLGNVYEGRFGGENVIGGHAFQYARGSAGICTIGNFMDIEPTAEALAGLVWITAWAGRFLDPYGLAPFHQQPNFPSIASHRDCYPELCPGDRLYAELDDVRDSVVQVLSFQLDPDPEPTFVPDDDVRVTVEDTNLRSGPGTDFSTLRTVPIDSRFTILDGPVANSGFTWYKLTGDLGLGWSIETNLELVTGGTPPEFEIGDSVAVDTDILNLRAAPGLSGTVVAQLVTGDVGEVLDGPNPADGYHWYRLRTSKGTGWCVSAYLVETDEPPPPEFQTGEIVTVATDSLRLRTAPSLSAGTIATMPFGTRLKVKRSPVPADGYTWYKVNSGKYGTGWCAGEFLAGGSSAAGTSSVFDVGESVYVVDGALNLRDGPGVGSDVIAVMADGATLTIDGGPTANGGYDWYRVRSATYGTGWCAGQYLRRT